MEGRYKDSRPMQRYRGFTGILVLDNAGSDFINSQNRKKGPSVSVLRSCSVHPGFM